jgi:UDPglucose 6-dehydrogenase
MKIAMIGTGYVGLVTGACFAARGNDVTCVDIDVDKIAQLNRGECPIYEPGLLDLIEECVESGGLHFTTDLPTAVEGSDVVFLAVCTPQAEDGSADLAHLLTAARQISPHLGRNTIVVIKSTAPPNTTTIVKDTILGVERSHVWSFGGVVYNPEFLREGTAVADFLYPDRVVIGTDDGYAAERMQKLYTPFLRHVNQFMVMTPESAAMVKYAANSFLAAKVSFINEMANICEKVGADINEVRAGIGKDARIGTTFLAPGVGYGGSCFPKDVRALSRIARDSDIIPRMLEATDGTNNDQKYTLANKIHRHFGHLDGDQTIVIWGLAFKPNTDDIREAPALKLIDSLLANDVNVRVFDPEAMNNVHKLYGDRIEYATDRLEALRDADALAINTEWGDFLRDDPVIFTTLMKTPVIFDGRNVFDPEKMREGGVTYYSIGREDVKP